MSSSGLFHCSLHLASFWRAVTLWSILILSGSTSVSVEAEMHRKVWAKPQKFWEVNHLFTTQKFCYGWTFEEKFSINLCLYATDHKDKTISNQTKQFSQTDENNFFSPLVLSINKQTWTSLQGSVNVFSPFKFTWQTEKLVICTGLVVNHLDSDVSLLGRTC